MSHEQIFLKLRVRRFLLGKPGTSATREELNQHCGRDIKSVVNDCVLEGLISLSEGGTRLTWHEEVVGLAEVLHG
jgi:hypothetical protein